MSRTRSDVLQLPVLPLRDVVVFPHMVISLFVGRDKSMRALEQAMEADKQILLLAQKSAETDDPDAGDLYTVGTLAQVLQLLKLPDGTIKVLVEGSARVHVDGIVERDGALHGRGELIEAGSARSDREVEAVARTLTSQFEQYVKTNRKLPPELLQTLSGIDDPARLADTVAAHIGVRLSDKQRLLESADVGERLELLVGLVEGEIDVQQMEKRIRGRVKSQMEKSQREYYLNEQMKAIQKELGDLDESPGEMDELVRRVAEAGMPKAVEAKARAELNKLKQMSPMSAEAAVVRNYLDWLLGVPWKKRSKVRKDLKLAQDTLDADHYGLEKVKERILEYLAVQSRVSKMKGPILCLVGPPGVGKTSLGQSIAKATNRKFVRMALGGVRDEAEIRGHRRTYIGAMPGKIINAMISAKSSNPLMLLDEIDKLAGDFRGDPAAALLEALDPEQNSTFNDHFIDMPFDLSHVLFITTANDLSAIPGPLRDRMDVIELPSYTRVEKYNIARKHLVPKQLDACGLTGKVTFSQSALYGIIDGYTREAGVRNLERTITSVLRKCARKIASGEAENVSVTGTGLEKLLGPRMVKPEFLNRTNAIGIANGLAWTSIGGETLPIEVQVIDNGSGKITVTGSLGDVMKESAQLAITYARVHAAEYGIDSERLKKCDLHIHAPEGAVPKDGPSAGVTLTTALISCLSGIPVRGDVAMTGEITLHGNVLPIGGLREKSMAAYREGMKTVLIPKDNLSDLYEVDDEVKKNIEFLPMSNLSQVLAAALLKPKTVSAGHPRTRKVKPAEAAALPQTTEKPQPGAVC